MAKTRPLIGLNMSIPTGAAPPSWRADVPLAYVDAVARAGGLPLLLPPLDDERLTAQVLGRLDGLCFIGGDDYLPRHFGGHAQPAKELMHPRRDRFDLALARRVLFRTSLPVLGVCGGQQLLAIACGGALVQDLRTEWKESPALPHAGRDRSPKELRAYRHAVRVTPGSLLARATRATRGRLRTNSFHHQAVKPGGEGRGLRATGWTEDGVVEAIEPAPGAALGRGGRFILGVQWHPERMTDDRNQRALFEALVRAAGR
jgi:putative glutamine amidotransferase